MIFATCEKDYYGDVKGVLERIFKHLILIKQKVYFTLQFIILCPIVTMKHFISES